MLQEVVFDGSLAGLLSVVFDVFDCGLQVDRLERKHRYQKQMFGAAIEAASREEKAKRVWKGLDHFPGFDRELVLRCWLFDTQQSDTDIVHLLKRLFREGFEASEDYRDEAIFRCRQVHKKMFREIHRMHAFVRFAEADDGLYFSRVEPDFDVLPLAIEHFEQRYQDQEWLIWDGRRDYGFWFRPGHLRAMRVDEPREEVLPEGEEIKALDELVTGPEQQSPHEDGFQKLWGTYFHSVNIEARANPRLHRRHVPPRYWKHLTEKQRV